MLSGRSILVDADPQQKIESIIPQIKEKFEINANDHVDLIFKSRKLNSNDLIESLNYKQNEFIIIRVIKAKAEQKTEENAQNSEENQHKNEDECQQSNAEEAQQNREQYQPFIPVPRPETYDANVRELLSLGFDLDIIERALVQSHNNPDLAAELIFSNRVPTREALTNLLRRPVLPANREPQEAPYPRGLTKLVSCDLGMKESLSHRIIRNFFLDNSAVAVQAIVEIIGRINPNLIPQIQGNLAPFLSMIGIYAQSSNNNLMIPSLNRITRTLSLYNQEQSDAISRLLRINRDLSIVIPIFESTGRNEETTANILRSSPNMNNNSPFIPY